jgi:hypothetical protein
MFLAGRCWRMLAGVSISASLVVAACFAAAGVDGMKLWLDTMRVFRYMATDEQSILRRAKYVDLNSFFVVLGGLNVVTKTAAFLLVAGSLIILAWAWFRSYFDRRILLAATIASTLILNVYVPVYDTPVLIPALVLAASVLKGVDDRKELQAWILLFCLVPWLTQSAADFLHVQLLTIAIAGFSYWTFKRRDYGRPERSLQ